MNYLKSLLLAVFVTLGVTVPVFSAEDDQTQDGWVGPKFIGKEWREAKSSIPPLPRQQDLMYFKVYNSSNRHMIDSRSLNLASGDNVARYTVVIVSPSGIRNILYEGIRCDTAQYKTYAYSINDRPFKPVAAPAWNAIPATGTAAFRHDLYQSFLCQNSTIRGKKKYIIQLFKSSPDHYDNENVD